MPRNHKKRRRRKPWLKSVRVNPDGSATFGLGIGGRFSMKNWPGGPPPTLGTVRRWMRQGEAEGRFERVGFERTGKPGRPAVLWGLPGWRERQP
jgi:hypothetical protein